MAGISKICIPLLPGELTIDKVMPYLPKILQTFYANKSLIDKNWNTLQAQHNILSKQRRYEDDSDVNNIVITPYLYAMVKFKTGYAFGNPKEYAQSAQSQTNGLKYLNRYSKDTNEREIDKNVASYIYGTGSGYYFIEPRRDDFDSEYEAPYVLYDKMPNTCAKIYSSYNGEPELFDILVTEIEDNTYQSSKVIVSLYLPDYYYEYQTSYGFSNFEATDNNAQPRLVYKYLPLVEKYANNSRIGIVELGQSLQNAIDELNSTQLDNIDDVVNQLLIFMNTILGATPEEESENLRKAKKNGVLSIFDKNPDIKADVKTITEKLDYNGVIEIIKSLKRDLFDTCGVPIPSSDGSSAGSKTGAVEKGNGYDNAYNHLLDDYNSFEKADREVLKRKLFICKNFRDSKVDDLYSSDIDIKYNPNMTDNMLTKSQSYVNFVSNGVPPVLAIQWTRISNDAITPSKMIEDYKKAQEVILNNENQLKNNNINVSDDEDING